MEPARLIVIIFLFFVGCMLGRLVNRLAGRIPQKYETWESLKFAFQNQQLTFAMVKPKWFHLIPILGTILLPGWSPFSGRHIRQREPIVELINGLLLAWLFIVHVPSSMLYADAAVYSPLLPQEILQGDTPSPVWLWLRFLFHVILLESLFIATLIDIDLYLIPDGSTMPAMLCAALLSLSGLPLMLVPVWFQDPAILESYGLILPDYFAPLLRGPALPEWIIKYPWLHTFAHVWVGFLVGGGITWGVRILTAWVMRVEALGFGDVILMALIGMFIGWQPVIIVFFLAAVLALIHVILTLPFALKPYIPYGPYLSAAAILTIIGWEKIWPSWLQIFNMGWLFVVLAAILSVAMAILLLIVELVKKILGIETYDFLYFDAWTSGDHLFHFSGETTDINHGKWNQKLKNSSEWEGVLASRGQHHYHTWKD